MQREWRELCCACCAHCSQHPNRLRLPARDSNGAGRTATTSIASKGRVDQPGQRTGAGVAVGRPSAAARRRPACLPPQRAGALKQFRPRRCRDVRHSCNLPKAVQCGHLRLCHFGAPMILCILHTALRHSACADRRVWGGRPAEREGGGRHEGGAPDAGKVVGYRALTGGGGLIGRGVAAADGGGAAR